MHHPSTPNVTPKKIFFPVIRLLYGSIYLPLYINRNNIPPRTGVHRPRTSQPMELPIHKFAHIMNRRATLKILNPPPRIILQTINLHGFTTEQEDMKEQQSTILNASIRSFLLRRK
ncbi:unnamed protein product [Fraxinus pennsylvanica]|uniref:Uncharacterized protein n=1 Tax=Fraxinus pennsylvanica TaxID=56036 RepID=A0AAD2A9Z4_9LAMI|nr:unnamed protein product [Fraxinus pennsylvanica]